jgi:tetratricopeptide (TPR) repeat protein
MRTLSSIAAMSASFATIITLAQPASAQSQADLASKLNDEGKELMYAGKYAEASAKFRDAVARVPEPKYFFNLCTSNFQQGKFDEAITACNAADKHSPTPELGTKISKLTERIKQEAKTQNIELHPTGGGGGDQNLPPDGMNPDPNHLPPDPNNPNPNVTNTNPQPNYTPAVGRPPAQGLFVATTADNKYTWTLGIDLFGGGGKIGRDNFYGSSSGGFRIKGDYLLNAAQRVGAQGYFQISHFGQGDMQSSLVSTLDVFDLGIAAYKHLCPRSSPRLCLTPLAGVQLALMSPAGENDSTGSQVFNYAALGGRLEIGLQYGIGRRMEHVLGVQLGVNVYSPVFSGPSEDPASDMLSIEQAGLDKGGAAAYVGFGYTYRFNTPLGSSPFVTLE